MEVLLMDGTATNGKLFKVIEVEGKVHYKEYSFINDSYSTEEYDNVMDVIKKLSPNELGTTHLTGNALILIKDNLVKEGKFKSMTFGDETIISFPQLEELVKIVKDKIHDNKWYSAFTSDDIAYTKLRRILKYEPNRLIIEPLSLYIDNNYITLSFVSLLDIDGEYILLYSPDKLNININELSEELKRVITPVITEMKNRDIKRTAFIDFYTENRWNDFMERKKYDELENSLYFRADYHHKIFL